MARDFNGSSDYLTATWSLSGPPLTYAMWINADAVAAYDGMILARDGGGAGARGLIMSGSGPGHLTYNWEGTADEYDGASGLAISTGTWYLAAVAVSTTAATVYLGTPTSVSSWTNTKTHNAYTPSVHTIGADTSFSRWFDGKIAEVAIWSATLSAGEIDILRKGFSPSFVRPDSLIRYSPLVRGLAENMAALTIVATSGSSVSDHPRIIYPIKPQLVLHPAAAPGGLSIPIAAYHYQHHLGSMAG